jgi:hypothetical protein
MSDDFKMLRRLVKVKFSVKHRGKESGMILSRTGRNNFANA